MMWANLLELVGFVEFFSNYTFRTMLVGTALIGAVAGALGSFLYLKKQSMISDVIGHSAILGITVSFVVSTAILGVNGRSMLSLTIGSLIASTLSVILANYIVRTSRIGIDAAMVICLGLFFGGGMVIMRVITYSTLPNRGGIEKYMFGNAATMTEPDLKVIGGFGALTLLIMLAFWKEFKVYIFDPVLAETQGFSARLLEPLLLGTITTGIVIGVKAVGLILMVGFAIMPGAAARQWTRHLSTMVLTAMFFGGASGVIGSYVSVNFGRVPTGPVVIIVLFIFFAISLLFAPERSILRIAWSRKRQAQTHRQAAPEARSVSA